MAAAGTITVDAVYVADCRVAVAFTIVVVIAGVVVSSVCVVVHVGIHVYACGFCVGVLVVIVILS